MSSTSCRLSDKSGPAEIFQIISEFFSGRKGPAARKNIQVGIQELYARDISGGPGLVGAVQPPDIPTVDMGPVFEKVAANKLYHIGTAASVIAQIDDDRIAVLEKLESRNSRIPTILRVGEPVESQIANVAFHPLHFFKIVIVVLPLPDSLFFSFFLLLGILPLEPNGGFRCINNVEVPVVGDLHKIFS